MLEGWEWGGTVSASRCFSKIPVRTGPPEIYPPSALVLLAPIPGGNESQVCGKWVELWQGSVSMQLPKTTLFSGNERQPSPGHGIETPGQAG